MEKADQVRVNSNIDGTTIVGIGALDLYNKNFDAALKEALVSAESVTVDLRSATYIDTAIIANLASAANKLIRRGKRLGILLAEGTQPLRVLAITGLGEIMDLVIDAAREQSRNL
ncbi:MAG TPA: hypothetical protein VHV83_22160 [Armatimonadota bacterium]|nr:hypothetical protein [Armatimonadota bacterium]